MPREMQVDEAVDYLSEVALKPGDHEAFRQAMLEAPGYLGDLVRAHSAMLSRFHQISDAHAFLVSAGVTKEAKYQDFVAQAQRYRESRGIAELAPQRLVDLLTQHEYGCGHCGGCGCDDLEMGDCDRDKFAKHLAEVLQREGYRKC